MATIPNLNIEMCDFFWIFLLSAMSFPLKQADMQH